MPWQTYEGKTAVAAGSNLGLVGVDEDLGVAQGTATTVTADDTLFRPADGLSVDELNGSQGLGLGDVSVKDRVLCIDVAVIKVLPVPHNQLTRN